MNFLDLLFLHERLFKVEYGYLSVLCAVWMLGLATY